MTGEPDLIGARVLVIEDEYYLAADLARALRGAGEEVGGPSPSEEVAMADLKEHRPDGAVVDVNLGQGPSFQLAKIFQEQGVLFVFITGYDAADTPAEFRRVPRLQQPVELRHVVSAILNLLTRRG